ncbi:MAG: asparagine synthase (glutamine-hydrolyzing) [Lachnospiraceae bacterium]|jgi:asparagine synthase (glutamine-hydrolysing)|nr:asparagine synthase (glutamine-hydrolyzing) [Lachnospiraceae bacterium]
MCSIAGIYNYKRNKVNNLERKLQVMNEIQAHRGPDGEGIWIHENNIVGFAHRRLSIIDLDNGKQPMRDEEGNWVCFNGEIYNYRELNKELGLVCKTNSDTEVVLHAYRKWGEDCVNHFCGMFAFALWDEKEQKLFCARDPFGIKPFYYYSEGDTFYFSSEAKALLPFLKSIETDRKAFSDYIVFQFCLDGRTLFQNIYELRPAYSIVIQNGEIKKERYWQVYYRADSYHTEKYFQERLEQCFHDSIKYHIRSDVPVGGYVSGGVDSSITSALASDLLHGNFEGFTGKFSISPEYDESLYAQAVADEKQFKLYQIDITAHDFIENIGKVIYHLDTPIAGPGSFSQYMVSKLASEHRKVVLGGQGGDEIFGGYARYLVAYFEQCIKGALDGTMNSGKFVVTYESIIPNLISLKNYKPMIKSFWRQGLFEPSNTRYYRLINRAPEMEDCIYKEELGDYDPYTSYKRLFIAENVDKDAYLDRMTHFDFKTLLPALLQVEDRMSMAHGIESRVPFLDKKLVEFAATIPADIKFKDGRMKYLLREAMSKYVPSKVMDRKDKMGFPTPFARWAKKEARDFILDMLSSQKAKDRRFINNKVVLKKIDTENTFARNLWGFFCLEMWQTIFHDQAQRYRNMLK